MICHPFFEGEKLIVGYADNFPGFVFHAEHDFSAGPVGKSNHCAGNLLTLGPCFLKLKAPGFRMKPEEMMNYE
jgi:hypothetical protein